MKENVKELYWSLIIEPSWVQAGLWSLENGTTHVLAVSKSLRWESQEDLPESVDSALSSIAQNLPEGTPEPSKTVFGVSPSWVEDGQIKQQHLETIKGICSKLSLTPSGFVVLSEAIAHTIKIKEESPLTGVVIGLGKENLDIAVFKLGNLQGSVAVVRSVLIVDDVVEGLARFATGGNLPSRFLIYNGKETEIEEVKDMLIKADWENLDEKVKFLHTPKVESVLPDDKILSVCLAGASEIGEVKSFTFPGDKQEVDNGEYPQPAEPQVPSETGDFVIGEDIEKVFPSPLPPKEEHAVQIPSTVPSRRKFSFKLPRLHLPVLKSFLPGIHLPSFSKNRLLTSLGIGGLLLFVGLLIAWIYIPRAKITILVSPKNIEKTLDLTLVESLDIQDLENYILPASAITARVTGEESISTTGSKTVGDKAAGEVTLRNGTAKEITLDEGSFITSSQGYIFTLSEDVTIPKADSPSSPGTANAKIQAEKIGSDYNLPSDESFSVSNYPKSEVDAIASTEIAGGSSREIRVVSEDDINSLENKLVRKLIEKGKKDLSLKTAASQVLIEDVLDHSVTSKDFNHKKGDEADSLNLSMELSVSSVVLKKEILTSLAQSLLENQIPSGFSLKEDQIKYNFKLLNRENNEWSVESTIAANLLPQINTDNIVKKVSGKYPPKAEEFLSQIPGFNKATVKVNPALPGRLGNIPFIKSHISIEVVAGK